MYKTLPEKMLSDFNRQTIGVDRMIESMRRLSNTDSGFPHTILSKLAKKLIRLN